MRSDREFAKLSKDERAEWDKQKPLTKKEFYEKLLKGELFLKKPIKEGK